MQSPVWSAPVRFAEVDQQGVVFNAHYLTYCDEAVAALFAQRSSESLDLGPLSARLKLVSSTLTWTAPATLGDVIEVAAGCERIGRTSITVRFTIRASRRSCCDVLTTYVVVDEQDRPTPVADDVRAALSPLNARAT